VIGFPCLSTRIYGSGIVRRLLAIGVTYGYTLCAEEASQLYSSTTFERPEHIHPSVIESKEEKIQESDSVNARLKITTSKTRHQKHSSGRRQQHVGLSWLEGKRQVVVRDGQFPFEHKTATLPREISPKTHPKYQLRLSAVRSYFCSPSDNSDAILRLATLDLQVLCLSCSERPASSVPRLSNCDLGYLYA
jgi:hypothetical protein